jgi:hypothetical protein
MKTKVLMKTILTFFSAWKRVRRARDLSGRLQPGDEALMQSPAKTRLDHLTSYARPA